MKTLPNSDQPGFSRIDLLAIIVVLGLLLVVNIPAFGRVGMNSKDLRCLNNVRQLGNAWRMYADDNRDQLVYASTSTGVSAPPGGASNWPDDFAWSGAHMDYNGANRANWDPTYDMMKRPLWAFTKNEAIYKCPDDRSSVVAAGGTKPRILTMSMNLYVGGFAPKVGTDPLPNGTAGGWSFANGFMVYSKASMIKSPSKIFVFLDMREDLVNWSNFMTIMSGFLPTNPAQYQFSDLPGFLHDGGAAFSFADGSGELHRWQDTRTMPPLNPAGTVPNSYASPNNPDVAWLQDHSTQPK